MTEETETVNLEIDARKAHALMRKFNQCVDSDDKVTTVLLALSMMRRMAVERMAVPVEMLLSIDEAAFNLKLAYKETNAQ